MRSGRWVETHPAGRAGVLGWRSKVRKGLIPAELQLAWFVRGLSRVAGPMLVRVQGAGYIRQRRGRSPVYGEILEEGRPAGREEFDKDATEEGVERWRLVPRRS